jgi:phosphate-selective porin OprO/OprP
MNWPQMRALTMWPLLAMGCAAICTHSFLGTPAAHAQSLESFAPGNGESIPLDDASDQFSRDEFVDSAAPPIADERISELEQKWEDFLKAQKAKPFPTITVNGVFQADGGIFNQSAASVNTFAHIQNGADFRRARLSAKGSVAENMNYFFQMDFAFFGRPTFTDLWTEFTLLPVLGNVRVGQWKQPFSLEVVSSFRFTTFMERSLLFQSFTPFRHLGVGFYDHSDDLSVTWAVSLIRTGQDQFGNSLSTAGGNGLAARLTWLPYFDEASDGRYYLHLGGGDFLNAPPQHSARFRSIPELFVGEVPGDAQLGTSGQPLPSAQQNGTPFFVDTGPLLVNEYNVLGGELLWVNGPFSLQSETMLAGVNQIGRPDAYLWGSYVQMGWFLTGEHRPYDRAAGAIDRVKPLEDFFRIRNDRGTFHGKGAWEIALRYSYLDLDSGTVTGGALSDTTLGINWYTNAYCKIVANVIHANLDNPLRGSSSTNIFGFRAQLDF